jgi:hypothetical protein
MYAGDPWGVIRMRHSDHSAFLAEYSDFSLSCSHALFACISFSTGSMETGTSVERGNLHLAALEIAESKTQSL